MVRRWCETRPAPRLPGPAPPASLLDGPRRPDHGPAPPTPDGSAISGDPQAAASATAAPPALPASPPLNRSRSLTLETDPPPSAIATSIGPAPEPFRAAAAAPSDRRGRSRVSPCPRRWPRAIRSSFHRVEASTQTRAGSTWDEYRPGVGADPRGYAGVSDPSCDRPVPSQMADHLLVGTLKRNSAGTAVADNLLSATATRDTALVAGCLPMVPTSTRPTLRATRLS